MSVKTNEIFYARKGRQQQKTFHLNTLSLKKADGKTTKAQHYSSIMQVF
jgi:hypothetical protein